MAKQDLSKSFESVKDFIRKNTEQNHEWTMLTIPKVCSEWNLPQYIGRIILIRLRLDPEIRIKLASTSSRFKPKMFYYDTPGNKLKDIGKLEQYELKPEEVNILISRLKSYITVDQLYDFSALMYIVEKLKTSCYDKHWNTINILEICKLMSISESQLLSYIDVLIKNRILIQSHYTLNYKLVIDEAAYKQAVHELDCESTNPEIQAKGKLNIEALNTNFDSLKTTEQFKSTVQALMELSGKNNAILMNQIKIIDALATEEKHIQMQKNSLIALNQVYNELKEKYDTLKENYRKAQEQVRLSDTFSKNYHEHIVTESTELVAYISSTLESYFRLPVHKKNDMSLNNKVKVEILNTIMEYQKKLTTYKGKNSD